MLPSFSLPDISFSIELLIKVLIIMILVGFLVYGFLIWRQVVLASNVLKTKATPWVRFIAMFYVVTIIVAGTVILIVLLF